MPDHWEVYGRDGPDSLRDKMKLPWHLEQAIRRICGSKKDFMYTMEEVEKMKSRGKSEREVIEALKASLESYRENVCKDPFAVNEKQQGE